MITLYNYLNCKNNKICIKRIVYFAESVYLSFVKHWNSNTCWIIYCPSRVPFVLRTLYPQIHIIQIYLYYIQLTSGTHILNCPACTVVLYYEIDKLRWWSLMNESVYYQGVQITATTPTSSAVRLETGSVELEVSNRVLMATAEAKDKRKFYTFNIYRKNEIIRDVYYERTE